MRLGLVRPAFAAIMIVLAIILCSCSAHADELASENDFFAPTETPITAFDETSLQGSYEAGIESSNSSNGYIYAIGSSEQRLKVEVSCNGKSYCCNLRNDGSPASYPLSLGNGTYTVKIMRNTSENRYVQVFDTTVEAALRDEFQPFLYPNFYCDYDPNGKCAKKARELTKGARNQGEAAAMIFDYVTNEISYDSAKAQELEGKTGYLPNPDETLASGTGVCTDFAVTTAAMLRSIGIPTKIVIGEVHPDNLPHAWNMIYVDESWKDIDFNVKGNEWSAIDPTLYARGVDLSKLTYDAIHEY